MGSFPTLTTAGKALRAFLPACLALDIDLQGDMVPPYACVAIAFAPYAYQALTRFEFVAEVAGLPLNPISRMVVVRRRVRAKDLVNARAYSFWSYRLNRAQTLTQQSFQPQSHSTVSLLTFNLMLPYG